MTVLCCFCKKELTESNWAVGLIDTRNKAMTGKFCGELCAVADFLVTVNMDGLAKDDITNRLDYLKQYITYNKDRHKKEKVNA